MDNSAFAQLIAPVAPEQFWAEHWESRYLHVPGPSNRFAQYFSLGDIDRWLQTAFTEPRNSVVLTAPEGAEQGRDQYRPQELRVEEAYQAFLNGRSMVLNHMERFWPPLKQLAVSLGSALSADIGINIYLTPAGRQTFPPHVDDHDVLVLQVQGRKEWHLREQHYIPIEPSTLIYRSELPYSRSDKGAIVETPELAVIELSPGDVLYIPRGMPHFAVSRNETSLHLTLSITPMYWTDFMKAAVEQAQLDLPALRRSLPHGFTHAESVRGEMGKMFRENLVAFLDKVSFEETLQIALRHRLNRQAFPLDGHFAQLDRLPELSQESSIAIRDGLLLDVNQVNGHCQIRFGSKHINTPLRAKKALEFMRDNNRFTVNELPALDPQSRLVIVRKLVKEGLLHFA